MIVSFYIVLFLIFATLSSILEICLNTQFSWNLYFFLQISTYIFLWVIIFKNRENNLINWKQVTQRFCDYPKSLFLISIIGFIVAVVLAYLEYSQRDVWGDEYGQFFNAAYSYGKNSITIAATQQQTALDYQLSLLASKIFGDRVISVRFFAIFCFLNLTLLIPFFAYKLFRQLGVSILAVGLILLNPYIVYYGIEGRPIMLALFWAILYIYIHFEIILSGKINSGRLLCVSILFAMTTGLQPIFLIGSVCLITALYFLKTRHRVNLKKYIICHALTAIVMIPSTLNIYTFSVPQNQFHSQLGPNLISYFKNFGLSEVEFFFSGYEGFLISFIVCIIFAIILFFKKRIMIDPILGIFYCAHLLFCVSFSCFFKTMINWNYYFRYAIVGVSLIVFCALIFFHLILKGLNLKQKHGVVISVFVILSVITFNKFYSFHRLNVVREFLTFDASFYDYLKNHSTKNDIILKFNLSRWGEWSDSLWTSNEFYMPAFEYTQLVQPTYISNNGMHLVELLSYEQLQKSESFQLFLVQSKEPYVDLNKYLSKLGLVVERVNFKNIIVNQIAIPEGRFKSIYLKLLKLVSEGEEKAYVSPVYDQIFHYSLMEKKLSDVENAFKSIVQSEKYIDPSSQDVELSWLELAERIVIYRQKMKDAGIILPAKQIPQPESQ